MALKSTNNTISRPSKIYPNWNFWLENKTSGNPGLKALCKWQRYPAGSIFCITSSHNLLHCFASLTYSRNIKFESMGLAVIKTAFY
jgi:hypothetical protein